MMAPERFEIAAAVEVMSMVDADVENLVSNSTVGTAPATEVLKTIDSSVGEWGSPSPPHRCPSTPWGAGSLRVAPSYLTAFCPGRDRR